MIEHTSIFRCDRCGYTDAREYRDQPVNWVGIERYEPLGGSEPMSGGRFHLCPPCRDLLTSGFLSGYETPAIPSRESRKSAVVKAEEAAS